MYPNLKPTEDQNDFVFFLICKTLELTEAVLSFFNDCICVLFKGEVHDEKCFIYCLQCLQ